jgi:LysM repeat protein
VHFFRLYLLALILFAATNLPAENFYRVKSGDTLTAIARQHEISLSALTARNHLRSTDSLLVGQLLVIPGAKEEPEKIETEYVVKPGDSLAIIAQKFDVTVASLAQRNRIKNPSEIKAGQHLEIPVAGISDAPGLSPELKKKLDHISVTPKRWKRIVIHHSGTSLDTVASMDRYHRQERHMENGLAYHFVIGNGVRTKDGQIYIGPRWTKQLDGGHLSSLAQNRVSIGICLVGNFNQRAPSERQLEAVHALVTYLMDRCHVSKRSVYTHRQINVRPTQCPGSKFPTKKFLATLP